MYSCQQKNIVLCIEVLSHDRRKRDIVESHPSSNYEEYSEDGERYLGSILKGSLKMIS